MVSLSFSFSYTSMIGIIVILSFVIYWMLGKFKSPMRKWVCFGLSGVSIVYLLYIMMWHDGLGNGQRLDWYLVGCVGIAASLGLAGIGFMDLAKPISVQLAGQSNTKSFPSSIQPAEVPLAANDGQVVDSQNQVDETQPKDTQQQEDPHEPEQPCEEDEEAKHWEELNKKVLPWFLDELTQYGKEEQDAIKARAIEFINDGTLSAPDVEIAKDTLYSQHRIMEICSCFILLGKERVDCAKFAKTVFSSTFSNTEISTLEKKMMGKDKMQLLIDAYWELKMAEKTGNEPKSYAESHFYG